jgi:hypothetical protein
MPIQRSTVISEPGLIQFNSQYFYSSGPVTVVQEDAPLDITTEAFGRVDQRVADRLFRVRFTPVGEWEALSTLYPYPSSLLGTEIFGASDTPLTIWTEGGRKYVFVNAAVTRMPTITPTPQGTLLGEVEFTCLIADNTASGAANAYYTLTTGETYPADAAFDKSAILTLQPALAWGSSPWDDWESEAGVTFDFALNLTPKVTERGTIGMRLSSLTAEATCKPVGDLAMSDVLTAVGAGAALGTAKTANDLIANYSGFYVKLNAATMTQDEFQFSTSENLIGNVRFIATRTFTTGEPDALFYVGTAAPV